MDAELKPQWQEVIDYIKRSKSATFPELENRFDWLGGGDRVLEIPRLNVLLWVGVSDEGAEFYDDRRVKDQIEVASCNWLLYAHDGKAINMPIAKRIPPGGYKKQRWAPVEFRPKRKLSPECDVYPEGK